MKIHDEMKDYRWMDTVLTELERNVKEQLMVATEKQMVENYKEQIRPIIRERVEAITFDKLVKMRELNQMDDSLKLFLEIKD